MKVFNKFREKLEQFPEIICRNLQTPNPTHQLSWTDDLFLQRPSPLLVCLRLDEEHSLTVSCCDSC